MKILIAGGGGREHALARSLVYGAGDGPHKVYAAPGNAGIGLIAECVPIRADDVEGLLSFAASEGIDFTIVGMEGALALGIADRFREAGLRVFGPVRNAARLEFCKTYAKGFMRKYGIPTAAYAVFNDYEMAMESVGESGRFPLVIKADGLALGKGVYICAGAAEAELALREIMLERRFGEAGESVVVEEYLEGVETTVLAFCDGKTVKPMESSMDYKKAYDGNKGPNTGGMGAVSPSPYYDEKTAARCMEEIFLPTVNGLISEGIEYKGIIYFGLMLTDGGPKLLEYNVRFGDPEAQVVLPRLLTNFLKICMACESGTLDKVDIKWDNKKSVCVVLASGGYPGAYETGYPITGIESLPDGVLAFHAGTSFSPETGALRTSGGRVLGITALGGTFKEAADKAYAAAGAVSFRDMYMRSDIGRDFNIG